MEGPLPARVVPVDRGSSPGRDRAMLCVCVSPPTALAPAPALSHVHCPGLCLFGWGGEESVEQV